MCISSAHSETTVAAQATVVDSATGVLYGLLPFVIKISRSSVNDASIWVQSPYTSQLTEALPIENMAANSLTQAEGDARVFTLNYN